MALYDRERRLGARKAIGFWPAMPLSPAAAILAGTFDAALKHLI
jgi:hypothetical protein